MSQSEARRRRLGPLEVIEIQHSASAPYVVLLHGYGADFTDLAPLARAIPIGRQVNWVFPNGHLQVELGPHMQGRAWFPLRMAELEQAMAAGTGLDLSQIAPPGLKRAREGLAEMLEKLAVPLDRVVLGGFSQGGMLATDFTLRTANSPAGLAILSGTLIDADNWRQLAAKRAGLRFFQSHGMFDPVLRIESARRLNALLREAGCEGKLLEFHGQHEIPPEVLINLADYLRRVLPKTN